MLEQEREQSYGSQQQRSESGLQTMLEAALPLSPGCVAILLCILLIFC